MSGDEYRTVTATILRVSANSFEIRTPPTRIESRTPGARTSIPRSLLHGADDRYIETMLPRGEVEPFEWTFRLVEWKAEQLGLAG